MQKNLNFLPASAAMLLVHMQNTLGYHLSLRMAASRVAFHLFDSDPTLSMDGSSTSDVGASEQMPQFSNRLYAWPKVCAVPMSFVVLLQELQTDPAINRETQQACIALSIAMDKHCVVETVPSAFVQTGPASVTASPIARVLFPASSNYDCDTNEEETPVVPVVPPSSFKRARATTHADAASFSRSVTFAVEALAPRSGPKCDQHLVWQHGDLKSPCRACNRVS